MSLLYRIKRLITADAHAFVEELEEPKWILAQAIRDMEAEIEKQANLISDKKESFEKMKKQIKKFQSVIEETESDIELSLDEKREDIAKHLIKKILINQKNLTRLQEQEGSLDREILSMESDLSEKRKSYEDVLVRSESLNLQPNRCDVFDEATKLVAQEGVLDNEVELEFIRRLKQRRGGDNA